MRDISDPSGISFHLIQKIFWNNIWRNLKTEYSDRNLMKAIPVLNDEKIRCIITVWGKVTKISCTNKLYSNLLPNINKKPWWVYILNPLRHLTVQTFNLYFVVYIYDCFWQILCPMPFCGENSHKIGKRSPRVIMSAGKTFFLKNKPRTWHLFLTWSKLQR